MPTPFSMTRDINGYNGFGLAFSVDKYSVTFAVSTDTTVTVPTAGPMGTGRRTEDPQYLAVFSVSAGSEVWVALNEVAEVPVGMTFAATTSELNPAARLVNAGDVIHMITDDASASAGVTFYGLF